VSSPSPIEPSFYEQRAKAHRERRDTLNRKSILHSNFRGLSFAVFIIAGGFALLGDAGKLGALVSAIGLITFVVFVARHAKVIDALDLEERSVRVNDDARLRVRPKGFLELSHQGLAFRTSTHPYADDLDLFGKGSLFQRLCVAHTEPGQTRLAEYLLQQSDIATVKERQTAVAALAPELELRQQFEVLALGTLTRTRKGESKGEPISLSPLLTWAEGPTGLSQVRLLVWAARLLPLLTALVTTCAYLDLVNRWSVFVLLVGHIVVLFKAKSFAGPIIEMLTRTDHALMQVGPLLKLLETHQIASTKLEKLKTALSQGQILPSVALKSFEKINGWFELREQGMIYPFVNLAFLWDLHCLVAFENWQQRHGRKLRGWFDCIGEMEALSSLAGLLHDEPSCCFAEFTESGSVFEAEALGHPLISPGDRICNDVSPLAGSQSLLVTGSNMSGKSTFLRAMGLGAVLALAGGPVCAKRLRLSPVQVATSMRISDSLSGGVSHFYAELHKLKAVLDVAQGTLPVFFLLDEVLHGTNSRERQIGARFVLAELLKAGGFGAVSTHDYELCRLEGNLAERVTLVHFRESVTAGEMTFDYRLRPGPVTEGNALRLMRGLGIDVPLDA
jgi:hypothetical protein